MRLVGQRGERVQRLEAGAQHLEAGILMHAQGNEGLRGLRDGRCLMVAKGGRRLHRGSHGSNQHVCLGKGGGRDGRTPRGARVLLDRRAERRHQRRDVLNGDTRHLARRDLEVGWQLHEEDR